MDPDPLFINKEVFGIVPKDVCWKYKLVPVDRIENTLMVAMAEPTNVFAIDNVKFMTGLEVVPVPASEAAIRAAIIKSYSTAEDPSEEEVESSEAPVESSPVIRIVNDTLVGAIDQGASHVHFHPLASGLRVSFRVDGLLREVTVIPTQYTPAIVSRLKILAKLDIAEKRIPMDGSVTIRLEDGRQRRATVCTLPTSQGERIVLTFDEHGLRPIAMNDLGFSREDVAWLKQAADVPAGLVLIAGPQKSGRSTTLYSMVDYLNTTGRCILTAEDPVGPFLDGVGQAQIVPGIGWTYAAAVQAIVRQNPDAIMVRDIRDGETAASVLHAATNGLPVFASVEADDAAHALLALIGHGGSPQIVGSAVRFVLAQRLVRRICTRCKADDPASKEAIARLSKARAPVPRGARFLRGAGCPECGQTGYRGRAPIGVTFTMSESVRGGLLKDSSAEELARLAAGERTTTFADQALKAASAGITTLDEYFRVVVETESR